MHRAPALVEMDSGTSRLERLKRLLRHASRRSPYFQRKLANVDIDSIGSEQDYASIVPLSQLEDLEAARARTGDPFSARRGTMHRASTDAPYLAFQLESDSDLPLYIAQSRGDLQHYADALANCWRLLGLGSGDRVAIFDFGSSPLSYLASSSYTPYLSRGAADSLGCVPVCNDGVSQMAHRAVEIARFIRPKVFFIRSDCVFPFLQEARRQDISLADYIGALAVAENESVPATRSCRAWADDAGVPVHRMLRVDTAMFLALECPSCHLVHVPDDIYFVETKGPDDDRYWGPYGGLVITNLFARFTPAIRYLTHIKAEPAGKDCPCAPEDDRFRIE